MSRDLMIDIESLDITPEANIISMGYLLFDPRRNSKFKRERLVVIEPIFTGDMSRDVSWSTLKFHLGLPEETHRYLLEEPAIYLLEALQELSEYIEEYRPDNIWANGVCFDIGILENAYTQLHLPIPWKFYDVRDARTLFKFCNVSKEHKEMVKHSFEGELHNPLVDAKWQAQLVRDCFKGEL